MVYETGIEVVFLKYMELHKAQLLYAEQLAAIYGEREARAMMQWLMQKLLGMPRHRLILERDRVLSHAEMGQLSQWVERLLMQEPLQYILGEAVFYGNTFKVNRHVLIPRSETEELVHRIIQDHKEQKRGLLRLLDIGTGSGCIPVSLKKELPALDITAIDYSEEALKVAEENAMMNRVEVHFIQMDFLNEQNWQELSQYHIIVSNPPYITRPEYDELETHVKDHEPEMALIASGDDAFIFYRKIAAFGLQKLLPGGRIYLELNAAHAARIREIFEEAGYGQLELLPDMQGKDRMMVAAL